MRFISLFSGSHGFVATEQVVYSASELAPLNSVLEKSAALDERLRDQDQHIRKLAQAAVEQGRAEGLQLGREEVARELADSLKSLLQRHDDTVLSLNANCAELAVDIVKRIAGNINGTDWLVAQAEHAAAELQDQSSIKIRVHGNQAAALRERLQSIGSSRFSGVIADDTLQPDACLLETPGGVIDIGLDTQLDTVLKVLSQDNASVKDTL